MKLRVIALASLLLSSVAHAQRTTQSVGTVSILGTNYFVSILFDASSSSAKSFNALLRSITFTTASDAASAAFALRDAFGANYDWSPASPLKGTRIAFASDASNYQFLALADAGLNPDSYVSTEPSVYGPFSFSRSAPNFYSFAQFTAVEVPEPASYPLLAVGIAGLVGVMRRRRAVATK